MKLTVLVALLASTAFADKCQPGMKYEYFTNQFCEGEPIQSGVYSDEDISKSNKCLDHYAVNKDDQKMLAYAYQSITEARERMFAMDNKLKHEEDVYIQINPESKGAPPPKVFKKEYPELEHLYFKWQESEEEFTQQLQQVHLTQEKEAILDYRHAYHNYYIALHKPGNNENTQEVIDAKKELYNAAKNIRGSEVSIKTIQNAEKYKIEEYKMFNQLVPYPQGHSNSPYSLMMKRNRRHMGLYLRRARAFYLAEIANSKQMKALDKYRKEVDEQTFSTYTSCGTKGIQVSVWDDPGCNDQPESVFFAGFGQCTKKGDKYYKITLPKTAMTDAIEFDQD